MAEQDRINLFVTRLLQQLADVYRECERRKVCTEAVCRDSSKLFKPWPKKEPQKKVKDPGRQETDRNAGGDTIPVEELAELRVLDRVLSKAKKVRSKYQDKLKELHTEKTTDGATDEMARGYQTSECDDQCNPSELVPTTEPSKTDKGLLKNKELQAPSELPKKGGAAHRSTASVGSRNAPSQKTGSIGVMSQAKLNRLLQKPCLASAPSGRRFTPAHASAPFRTDPGHQRRSKVMRGGSKSHMRQTTSPLDAGSCVEGCTLETRLCGDITRGVTDEVTMSQRHHLTEDWLQQSAVSGAVDGQYPVVTTGEAENGHQTLVTTHNLNTRVDSQHLTGGGASVSGHPTSTPQAGGDGSDGQNFFLLKRDGHSLTLPRNLVRAASINCKLRHKVQRAAITSPVTRGNTQSAAAEFKLKLHNYMCEGLSEDLRHLLQQLHALCDIYDALSTTLQQLSAPQLHEGSSWQEVLRCQKTVEYVFTLFADLDAGYKDIKTKVQHVTVKEISDMKRPGNTSDLRHRPSLWLPAQLTSGRLELPTLLKYKHKKQLSSYTAQLHALQVLQLCRYTTTTVEKEMLPVLQQMAVDHPSYLALYRAVYALLCTRGQRFPVMVQDIPEAEGDTLSEDINDF